jgi:ribonuclease D
VGRAGIGLIAPVGGPQLVTDAGALRAVVEELREAPLYALDTEFHRERTYWPSLALVQLAWRTGPGGPVRVALVDPLGVDPCSLADVLNGPGTMVAHAADQDIEVLQRACGTVPRRLFDTQLGAGFAGHGSASLAALTHAYLGVRVTKGDRLADWSRRPLRPSELTYAASDVEHLLPLADAVTADLQGRGRLAWAEDECELLRSRPRGPTDPERAWWRLRDSRQLRGPGRGVAQEVAAWRERRARDLDIPPRQVLPDLALQALAARPPASVADLYDVRGLEPRYLRNGVDAELMDAVARGAAADPATIKGPPSQEVGRELRPAVALAAAWVAQLAHDERVDAALLATRADLVAFIRGDSDARLGRGWRLEVVGRPLRRLVAGEAALAYLPGGRLALEERSGQPLVAT